MCTNKLFSCIYFCNKRSKIHFVYTQIYMYICVTKRSKMIQAQISEARQIINQIKGKNVIERRKEALKLAGFLVYYYGVKYNFGKSGTIKQSKDIIYAQLSCAKAGRAKNGYIINRCEVYMLIFIGLRENN